jgi:hypothetical protein
MKKNTEYANKLRDPRWQKKRLEVMEKAQWKCERCNASDKELQVHHGMYEYNKDPWDYDTSVLWCLCKRCHEAVTEMKREMQRYFGLVLPGDYDLVGRFTKTLSMLSATERTQRISSWPPDVHPIRWEIIGNICEWDHKLTCEQEGIE